MARRLGKMPKNLIRLKWRQGRTLERAVFAVVDERSAYTDDVFIAMFDDPEIAAEVVDAHNFRLEQHKLD